MNDSTTPVNDRNEWRTPEALVNYCASLVGPGGFDYDTACTLENAVAKPVWYKTQFFGLAPVKDDPMDALTVEWAGRCFCNPPYDDITPWIGKAISSHHATTVMVIPSPNGEHRYGQLLKLAFEHHIIGRIAFIGTDGKPKTGNPRGTSIFVINSNRPLVRRDVVYRSAMQIGRWDRPAPVWRFGL